MGFIDFCKSYYIVIILLVGFLLVGSVFVVNKVYYGAWWPSKEQMDAKRKPLKKKGKKKSRKKSKKEDREEYPKRVQFDMEQNEVYEDRPSEEPSEEPLEELVEELVEEPEFVYDEPTGLQQHIEYM